MARRSTCPVCGTRAASESPTTPCLFCETIDGADGAVGLARLGWALQRFRAKEKAKAEEAPRTIAADPSKRLRRSDDVCELDAAGFDALCSTLAIVRHRDQRLPGEAAYDSTECAGLRKALRRGLKPSTLIAAMKWAANDADFWGRQTLSFHVLAQHGETWAANAAKASSSPTSHKDRRAALMAEARRLIEWLRRPEATVAQLRHADDADAVDLGREAIEAVEDHVAALRATCKGFGLIDQ